LQSTADVPLSAPSVETTSGKTSDNEAEKHETIQQRGHDDGNRSNLSRSAQILPRLFFLLSKLRRSSRCLCKRSLISAHKKIIKLPAQIFVKHTTLKGVKRGFLLMNFAQI
jgi:hypothetical protein